MKKIILYSEKLKIIFINGLIHAIVFGMEWHVNSILCLSQAALSSKKSSQCQQEYLFQSKINYMRFATSAYW